MLYFRSTADRTPRPALLLAHNPELEASLAAFSLPWFVADQDGACHEKLRNDTVAVALSGAEAFLKLWPSISRSVPSSLPAPLPIVLCKPSEMERWAEIFEMGAYDILPVNATRKELAQAIQRAEVRWARSRDVLQAKLNHERAWKSQEEALAECSPHDRLVSTASA